MEGALRIRVDPDHEPNRDSPFYTGTQQKERRGNPYIDISGEVTNISDQNVYVGACSAVALDRKGQSLFSIDPGFTGWVLPAGILGRAASKHPGSVAPDGVTLLEVRAAARYDVSCTAYQWIGRLPNYDYVSD